MRALFACRDKAHLHRSHATLRPEMFHVKRNIRGQNSGPQGAAEPNGMPPGSTRASRSARQCIDPVSTIDTRDHASGRQPPAGALPADGSSLVSRDASMSLFARGISCWIAALNTPPTRITRPIT